MAWMLVENLPRLVIEKDMDDMLSRHGRIVSLQIKFPSRDTTFAFVEYASTKDAESACRELQGFFYNGSRLRTELFHPSGDAGPRSQVATQHRVQIGHLPPSATTRDVTDLLSAVADVMAVEVDRRGTAWATFATHYDLDRVISKFADADYRGERLRVKRDETPIFRTDATAAPSHTTSRTSRSSSSTAAPSPTSSRSRHERAGSSTRSRSRSRSPHPRRRSASPARHRNSSSRRSRSRSRSPAGRSAPRRYTSRSRSRSR